MLALLSPAKTLDFDPPARKLSVSQPALLEDATDLAARAQKLGAADLMRLMSISKNLADLNVQRFKDFSPPFSESNAKAAILAFRGDTYIGFDVDSLDDAGVKFAQKHVRILSGLYGLLRPLDLIQPYRLEMGTKFATPKGKDLYAYWGTKITSAINDAVTPKRGGVVVNLASNEYFSSVRLEALKPRLVTCVFKEVRGGQAKVVSFSAKRARGMMARFICEHRLTKVDTLKDFDTSGYVFQPKVSDESTLEFHRKS
jgi:cytoplasmic iron level regulating protein YaaA (DUF328/UPF0246 family)